jgi:curved DNA-binding protein CbpA
MQVIQHQELTGSQSAITFSSIPQTFTDLFVQLSVRSSNADDNLYFKFNNTTSNTSWRNLLGYGTGVLSQSGSGYLLVGGVRSNTASTFTNMGVYIPNYANGNAKTASVDSTSEENGSTGYQFIVANLWNDTTAINRIDFYLQGGSLQQYSSATLYGVLKGSDGIVTVS